MKEFKKGEVWMSSRGNLYRVKDVIDGQAILRLGVSGRGSITRRKSDATNHWTLYNPASKEDSCAN